MPVTINQGSGPKKKADQEPKMTFIQKVIKGDTYTVLADSSVEIEDAFTGLYFTSSNMSNVFLEPPFEPRLLQRMINTNNTLSQCVDVMEVNIDGTGYSLVASDTEVPVNAEEEKLVKSFFDEPFPGKSFITIRRALRRDLEACGWAFLEVLRNPAGELVAVRNTLTRITRMVKLDDPVVVTRTITRNGKEVQIKMQERERRFGQKIVNTFTYFREYGSSRQLNKFTGRWETLEEPVPLEMRASELLMFTANPDTDTMYALPRWINNMPAVLGSRKSEEQNLEYFDAGGVPPAIIFVQGGTLAKDMTDQLRMYLSGQMKAKNRAVVVEATSTSGSLDGAAGTVQVKVERFGATDKDPMYATYDKDASEKVRTAFRLPPLFLGKVTDYNFATAQAAYQVAEAQVFSPEREEFDEIINKTFIKELGVKTLKFKSNPITMKDLEQQLQAFELVMPYAKKNEMVQEIGKVAGINVQFDAEEAKQQKEAANLGMGLGPDGKPLPVTPGAPPAPGKGGKVTPIFPVPKFPATLPKVSTTAKSEANQLIELAYDFAVAKGYLVRKTEMAPSEQEQAIQRVRALDVEDRETVFSLVSSMTLNDVDPALLEAHDH